MNESGVRFIDISGTPPSQSRIWRPVKVPGEAIAHEIERLSAASRPANGIRASLIVHPNSTEPGLGFAPGVDITINVLNPGEETVPQRRNSNQIEICIRGGGTRYAGAGSARMAKWDVATIPSMQPYWHRNDGDEPWVRLSYSNAPLLDKLGVHYYEDATAVASAASALVNRAAADERYTRHTAPDVQIGDDGARIRGYEFLTDIQVVSNPPLHWPWEKVAPFLAEPQEGKQRSIFLLYNPATERRNGTTHSFFATMSWLPPGCPPRPPTRGHRHTSVAINYHFSGSGQSVVDGQTIDWKAGDLLLSAPGWSEHAHFVGPQGLGVLTVQDHPLHIGMESLIWQERIDGPILTLGSEAGQTGYIGPRQAGT